MNRIFSPRVLFVVVAVALAAITRILPHPPNFTAVGAMALFAGACLNNRWLSLIVPVSALFVTDLVLGFHNTMWAVYGAMMLTTMIGWMIREKHSVLNIFAGSIASVLAFFFITNAAVWMAGFGAEEVFYPTNFSGLVMAIEAGIPFLDKSILSQLLYSGILFGAFYIVRNLKPSLVKA